MRATGQLHLKGGTGSGAPKDRQKAATTTFAPSGLSTLGMSCSLSLKMTPCTLSDVVHSAPCLLQLLSHKSKAALSACSRQLRHLTHQHVKVILLQHIAELDLIAAGDWPQLVLVILRKQHVTHFDSWQDDWQRTGTLQLLTAMNLSCGGSKCAALVVATKTASPLQISKQANAAFVYLRSKQQADIQIAAMMHNKLGALCTAPLSTMNWQNMTILNLIGCGLDGAAVLQLVKGQWPSLTDLNMCVNRLDIIAVKILIQGKWPSLQAVQLTHNPLLDCSALALIPHTALWPALECLSFSDLMYEDIHGTLATYQTSLRSLLLDSCTWTTCGRALLSDFSCTHIQHLSLHSSHIGKRAVKALLRASLPCLCTLDLDNNNLHAEATKWLVRGEWPNLCRVSLSANCLDDLAMSHLSAAKWPQLRMLSLEGNAAGPSGVKRLFTGKWPKLQHLRIDAVTLSPEVCDMLCIQHQGFPAVAKQIVCTFVAFPRCVELEAAHSEVMWPDVTEVVPVDWSC